MIQRTFEIRELWLRKLIREICEDEGQGPFGVTIPTDCFTTGEFNGHERVVASELRRRHLDTYMRIIANGVFEEIS